MMIGRVLQLASLVVILSAAAFWFFTGANFGWTKTSIPIKTMDEVTGIEGITYKRRFLPGVDFLGAALLGSGILACSSLAFRKQSTPSGSRLN